MTDKDNFISAFDQTQGHLPHWEELGATYFVCFCLRRPPIADLTSPNIAQMLVQALRHFDQSRYLLYDYVIMPDHVHAIMQPIVRDGKAERITRITRNLKTWTARQINASTGHAGEVWQEETYDHIIRNRNDFEEKARYIFSNPYAAGLVADPADWPWSGRGLGSA